MAFERRGRKRHYNLNGSKRDTGQQKGNHGLRNQNSDTLLTSAYALRFEPIRHSSSGQKRRSHWRHHATPDAVARRQLMQDYKETRSASTLAQAATIQAWKNTVMTAKADHRPLHSNWICFPWHFVGGEEGANIVPYMQFCVCTLSAKCIVLRSCFTQNNFSFLWHFFRWRRRS